MKLEIFVIFHKRIYPEMYADLDDEELKCIRFVAVKCMDGTFPEMCETPNGTEIIKEWELPIYNSEWQEKYWMNGGVNHHIVLNNIAMAEYMGFVQYDMKFTKGSIHKLLSMLQPNIGISIKTMNFLNLLGTSTFGLGEFNMYNFALTQFPPLKAKNFALFHNCFMLKTHYDSLMPIVLKIDNILFDMHNRPGDPYYRFAITTERTLALGISSVVDEVIEFKDITHERLQ
jgi:hypothetical protein